MGTEKLDRLNSLLEFIGNTFSPSQYDLLATAFEDARRAFEEPLMAEYEGTRETLQWLVDRMDEAKRANCGEGVVFLTEYM